MAKAIQVKVERFESLSRRNHDHLHIEVGGTEKQVDEFMALLTGMLESYTTTPPPPSLKQMAPISRRLQ